MTAMTIRSHRLLWRWAAASVMLLAGSLGQAVTWDQINGGDRVLDGAISIGRFQFKLPSGVWYVIAKGSSTSAGWMNAAAPIYLDMSVSNEDAGQVRSVLHFSTIANSANAIWDDDFCMYEASGVLLADRDGDTRVAPECLIFMRSNHASWRERPSSDYYRRMIQVIDRRHTVVGDDAFHVRYLHAYRQDRVIVQGWLPGKSNELKPEVVLWGKALRASVRRAMAGEPWPATR